MQMDKYSAELEELNSSIKAAQESAIQFNSREAIFGLPPTDYANVKKLRDAMDPFHQFWTTANKCVVHVNFRTFVPQRFMRT